MSCPNIGTYSIVARDPESGELGIAVASRALDVGYFVPWIRTGCGAVACQGLLNPALGLKCLRGLAKGITPADVIRNTTARDPQAHIRQIGIVDARGRTAIFSGRDCIPWTGHRMARGVTVQGNCLTGPIVIDRMFDTFNSAKGPLAERLLRALEAGDKAGGDKRGKLSAALLVRFPKGGYKGSDDRLVDIRVARHREPLRALRQIYETWQYHYMTLAYLGLSEGKQDRAFLRRARYLLIKANTSRLKDAHLYNFLAEKFRGKKGCQRDVLRASLLAHRLQRKKIR